jgi:LysR substrate binding domain
VTDVERAPLVAYGENLPMLRRYWREVFGTRLTRAPAVVVPDLRGVLATVAAGAGVTVLPRYLCAADLADGRLQVLAEPELPPVNTLFLTWRDDTQHPAAAAVRGAPAGPVPDVLEPRSRGSRGPRVGRGTRRRRRPRHVGTRPAMTAHGYCSAKLECYALLSRRESDLQDDSRHSGNGGRGGGGRREPGTAPGTAPGLAMHPRPCNRAHRLHRRRHHHHQAGHTQARHHQAGHTQARHH